MALEKLYRNTLIEREALRLLRTNSVKEAFNETLAPYYKQQHANAPIVAYRKEKSRKNSLVTAKITPV